mmetsp:Transcript_34843/g.80727  ORF Transcript_34843/g.80727 Transcript_34843/m.80727 type:complete len:242 (-) Transcript_34843:123-848(-)
MAPARSATTVPKRSRAALRHLIAARSPPTNMALVHPPRCTSTPRGTNAPVRSSMVTTLCFHTSAACGQLRASSAGVRSQSPSSSVNSHRAGREAKTAGTSLSKLCVRPSRERASGGMCSYAIPPVQTSTLASTSTKCGSAAPSCDEARSDDAERARPGDGNGGSDGAKSHPFWPGHGAPWPGGEFSFCSGGALSRLAAVPIDWQSSASTLSERPPRPAQACGRHAARRLQWKSSLGDGLAG